MKTWHTGGLVLATLVASVMAGACKRREEAPRPTTNTATATPAGDPPTGMFQALPAVGALPEAKVTLGRRLFHDTQLSANNTVSCASCHSLDQGGAEARVSSLGINGQVGPINSPTVLNARFNFVQFWDGRAANLTEQAGGPVTNPKEMGNTWPNAVATLGRDPTYVEAFRAAYPSDGITEGNVRDAIATYEMTLVTPSRFDRYLQGQRDALNAQERAGLAEFVSLGCTACHAGVNIGGAMYQKMGLVRNYFADRGHLTEADNGRFNVTHQESNRYFFKVPTLRNVALTAPYLHDGTQRTLPDVVRVMARYQLGRELDAAQVERLVAFLNALTGEIPAAARMPAAPAAPAAPAVPAAAPAAPAAAAH
jgi:cytochrome c peroxidase